MKVSVVMTTYNGEKYLEQMLDSLRKQNRKIDEVLFFDDQSTDGTVSLIENYIEHYNMEGWQIRVNKKNLGWEKNFTQGLQAATGDIIFPCDQDDIWHLDKVEKMARAFEQNTDILLLVSGYHAFSQDGGKLVVQQAVKTETREEISRVVFNRHYYQILRPGCTMGFRRDIISEFLQLWKPGTPHDALLWAIASIQGRLYLYDKTFIEYRRHDANASKKISHGYKYKVNEAERTLAVNQWYLAAFTSKQEILDIVTGCNIWCEYRIKLLKERKRHYWIKLLRYCGYYLTKKKYLGDLYYSFVK